MVPDVGKIPLADALLIEDPSDHGTGEDDGNFILLSRLRLFLTRVKQKTALLKPLL